MLEVVHFYLSDVSARDSILLSLISSRVAADHSLVLYVFLARIGDQVGDPEHLGLRRAVPALPQQVLRHDLLVKLGDFSVLCGPIAVRLCDCLLRGGCLAEQSRVLACKLMRWEEIV